MNYLKKPVRVEAFQWAGDTNDVHEPKWFVDALDRGEVVIWRHSHLGYHVKFAAGQTARPGDWVIKAPLTDAADEVYPETPRRFEVEYEAA